MESAPDAQVCAWQDKPLAQLGRSLTQSDDTSSEQGLSGQVTGRCGATLS